MNNVLLKIFKKYNDYVVLLLVLLVTIFIKLCDLGNHLLHGILLTNTLDFSWQTDIVERLLHGFLAGRDFIITYGPVYQIIASVPSLFFKLPSYNGILYSQILLYCLAICLLFVIAKLLVLEKKIVIFLFLYLLFILDLFMFPDANNLVRILVPLFYALVYIKFATIKQTSYKSWFFILSLPAIAGLYVYDLFLLLFGLTIISIILDIFRSKNYTQVIFKGLLQIGIVIGFELLVSLFISHGFTYLFYSLTTVRDYQFIENIPFSSQSVDVLFIFPLSLIITMVYIYKKTTWKNNFKQTLLILTITALLALKSAFIRSDEGHILSSVYPSIIVLFIIFFFLFRQKGFSILLSLFFVAFYLLIPFKDNLYPIIIHANLKAAVSNIYHPRPFFEIYNMTENYYYSKKDFSYFSKLIRQNPGNVFIYPYDNYILNIDNQTYNTVPLQFYDYSNSIVEQRAVERLQKNPPKYIILGVDTKGAVELDNIPNFSRNPMLAKWIISNYSVHKNTDKYLILQLNRAKKTTINPNCPVFTIDTKAIMHSSLFENIFKPSTYYLNNYNLRLPYKLNTKDIFIVDGFTDPNTMVKLFATKIDFNRFKFVKQNGIIIKKYPIPKVQKTFKINPPVKCY